MLSYKVSLTSPNGFSIDSSVNKLSISHHSMEPWIGYLTTKQIDYVYKCIAEGVISNVNMHVFKEDNKEYADPMASLEDKNVLIAMKSNEGANTEFIARKIAEAEEKEAEAAAEAVVEVPAEEVKAESSESNTEEKTEVPSGRGRKAKS